MYLPVWAVQFLVNTPYMSSVCGKRACWGCTLESTSSCTTVLVVSSTRTVCKSFSSSKPFSISCHSMLMMFPAAACHTHTNTHTMTVHMALYEIIALHYLNSTESHSWGTLGNMTQQRNAQKHTLVEPVSAVCKQAPYREPQGTINQFWFNILLLDAESNWHQSINRAKQRILQTLETHSFTHGLPTQNV